MDNVTLRMTGAKEVDEVLRGLPLQVNHKFVQNANASAAKVLVNQAKLLAPEGPTGNTVDSIGVVKPNYFKASDLGLIEVGPRRGRYKGSKAHLTEFGTKARYNKSGAYRGAVKAQHWMERSWDMTKNRVANTVNEFLGLALWRYMKRTIKNG